jgi:DNA-binding NarL/FixJ family response regulator
MTVRVLIADDHAPFRLAAASVVRSAACFELVGVADSGEHAIELAGRLRPDLALMDIGMPGIGGIEAARRIASAHPETVTILVSTYLERDLPEAAHTCGAAGYVHKADFGTAVLARLWERWGQASCATLR